MRRNAAKILQINCLKLPEEVSEGKKREQGAAERGCLGERVMAA